jgi:hypothetical protein
MRRLSFSGDLREIAIFAVAVGLSRYCFGIIEDFIDISSANVEYFNQAIVKGQSFRIVLVDVWKRAFLFEAVVEVPSQGIREVELGKDG